jgi:serine/threonine-protein kinase
MTAADGDEAVLARARARVGQVLVDKWRIDQLIAVGGMASVYAATHRNNKRVALKLLHPELCGDKDVRQRFLSEGYAANIVEHEGAVSVLDDDVLPDGAAFLVMELLDGETLEHRWERKGKHLPLGEVLAFADQLLDVLSAAHAKQIVHRDIKPENLFLTRTGQLKVLDFGIARVFESQKSKSQTRAGTVMGTPAFMAPEQARARWDEVDGRTDLWAAGATMFTLLSGQNVHEAQTGNEQLILSATTPPRSIATVVQGLPRSVVATLDRALAFEREQRWPTAAAMQEAVRGSLAALSARGADASASGPRTSMSPGMAGATLAPAVGSGASLAGAAAPAPIHHQATMLDASGAATWAAERDARGAEVAQLRQQLADAQARFAAAKKKTAEVRARIEATSKERQQHDRFFTKQVGTRAAAVEQARKAVRQKMSDFARRALADHATFGDDLGAAREEAALLDRAAEARARDVVLHEKALVAYDARAWKRGLVIAGVVAFLLLALLVTPIVWRLLPTDPADLPPLPSTPSSS